MTAREAVTGLLTAYLVTVLTLAWLAAVAGGLRVLGALWSPIIADVLGWVEQWGAVLLFVGIVGSTVAVMLVATLVPLYFALDIARMRRMERP